ncbi:FAD-dependent pyridine nucleotide-disulphide oxidoreductase [Acidimicrobium ferrooxidans DSM 10331]|uniref:FAD-dependent pyridine nucleotide-disulphide oxidoreductase n=1 Tax=Acidimicrobium ferrooxidans (strain DSM 10331 / JCM 15462 / NBRC 103882 / ICP) TaxID=525909 RepID=C7M3C4_ACIFD|nr:FAD-dependent oxidoreductase [Acidimicrobium ferrooxidans]ACU53518.1 FAD-dependent pyridine nucleotide-disulphide oxidoreductase [Acidimicrobium ferrooxidans DSM 10331]
MTRLVVVGASLAGHRAALEARRRDADLDIVVIGDEPHPPYQRPPLSKGLLAGHVAPERTRLRTPSGAYTHRPSVRAEGIDLDERTVATTAGPIGFDLLVIATGAAPLHPAPLRHPNALTLRTLDDALRLRDRLVPGHRLVTLGAGFIGLELAATARERGCRVTVVEAAERILPRALGPRAATTVLAWHEANGVTVVTGHRALAVDDDGVALDDGTRIGADTVVVGLGVRPATDWISDAVPAVAGLGLVCDAYGRIEDGIAAAGDVATWHHPGWGRPVRSEHFETAATQGQLAARNLLGGHEPWRDVPFGWSDQHGHLIQVLGTPGADADEEQRSDSTFAYYRDGRLEGFVLLDVAEDVVERRHELERALELS